VLRLRALDRRRAHKQPPVRELAGLRLDPFRREVYRDGRTSALTKKQFAVLEVLVALKRMSAPKTSSREHGTRNADPYTNAPASRSRTAQTARRTWIIATVAGVGYRIRHLTQTPSTREKSVDRAPGLSARLELTLSYAGFLMLAGVLMLAAVGWSFCAINPRCALPHASSCGCPIRPLDPCTASARSRPSCWRSCWYSAC